MLYFHHVDADYSVKPVPNTLTLNVNNTLKCVSVNITDDNIVEGTEIFRVRFNETDKNQIMIAGLDTIPVFISDDEGKCLIPIRILKSFIGTKMFFSQ